jgi:hypothetical protein
VTSEQIVQKFRSDLPKMAAHHPGAVIAGILNVKAARALTGIAFRLTLSAVCADKGVIPRFERAINRWKRTAEHQANSRETRVATSPIASANSKFLFARDEILWCTLG